MGTVPPRLHVVWLHNDSYNWAAKCKHVPTHMPSGRCHALCCYSTQNPLQAPVCSQRTQSITSLRRAPHNLPATYGPNLASSFLRGNVRHGPLGGGVRRVVPHVQLSRSRRVPSAATGVVGLLLRHQRTTVGTRASIPHGFIVSIASTQRVVHARRL